MIKFQKLFLFFLLLISTTELFSQSKSINATHREIKWAAAPKTYININGVKSVYYDFEGASRSFQTDYLPIFSEKIKVTTGTSAVAKITNEIYVPVSVDILKTKKNLSSVLKINQTISDEAKQDYLVVDFIPMRLNPVTNALEQLQSFDLQITVSSKKSSPQKGISKSASNSVLSSGKWFQISVSASGIYKIDKAFLSGMGMDVNNINPKNIRLYGNGGGMVAQKNSVTRYDDLHENPIVVVGESDNTFDAGDYILFYGEQADKIYFNSSAGKMAHEKNLYSTQSYYFITTDLGAGKRIAAKPSLGSFNQTVTAYDDFQYRDLDEINLGLSGRQWFEKNDFLNTPNRNYSFTVNNRITAEPVSLKVSTAVGNPTANSFLQINLNGVNVQTHVCPLQIFPGYENALGVGNIISTSNVVSGSSLTINATYNNMNDPSGNAWLDYIEAQSRCSLIFSGSPFFFRDIQSVGVGNIVKFQLQNASGISGVWDITDPVEPQSQSGTMNGSTFEFNASADTVHQYVAYNGSNFLSPQSVGVVANQNLHGLLSSYPQLIIVSHPDFMAAANELKTLHESLGQTSIAVNINQIYNEFGSGKPDIAAVRDFVKMFYDAAGTDVSKTPKYLMLVGDGSYDNRNIIPNNTLFIPTYQSLASLEPVYSYCSDDFYGMLSPTEGSDIDQGSQLLDIAVGRLPVQTVTQANDVVNKIKHYRSSTSFGNWRNMITFVADDENLNLHMSSADALATGIATNHPVFNIDKIYLDSYKQEESSAGSRYPDAHDALIRRIESGTSIVNYTGHGGETGWCHERVLQTDDILALTNFDKLSIFITATCQFSRYDLPTMTTAGEALLLNPNGGAIGLLTTVRLVYSSDNQAMNTAVYNNYFNLNAQGRHYTFGEVTMLAKNDGSVGKAENNRKFTLLGDPALPLPFPEYNLVNTFVNNHSASAHKDTIQALKKFTIKGEVRDLNGNKLTGFNGIVYPTLYDKGISVATLANDPYPQFADGSIVQNFSLQKNAIYRGKASVKNGDFSYTFIVPKDIAYNFGTGKFSYYGNDNSTDATGFDNQIIVGGISNAPITDKTGPTIKLFMNDLKFVSGGITDINPTLLINLYDVSGINTTGSGIGHELTAVMDEDSKEAQILNDFYEADLDNYQKGSIKFPYSKLKPGKHSIKVKVWDVYNNSSETTLNFEVVDNNNISIAHVYNYPNPFFSNTQFMFEHNQVDRAFDVSIKIFSVSGKLVKTISQKIISAGYLTDGITWDGTDDFGDKLGRGVYIYKVMIKNSKGITATQMQKLVIL